MKCLKLKFKRFKVKTKKMNKKKRMIVRLYFILLVALMLYSTKDALGQIKTEDYEVSISGINERMKIGNYKEFPITIKNNKLETISVFFSLDGNITEFLKLSNNRVNIEYNSEKSINITIADKDKNAAELNSRPQNMIAGYIVSPAAPMKVNIVYNATGNIFKGENSHTHSLRQTLTDSRPTSHWACRSVFRTFNRNQT